MSAVDGSFAFPAGLAAMIVEIKFGRLMNFDPSGILFFPWLWNEVQQHFCTLL